MLERSSSDIHGSVITIQNQSLIFKKNLGARTKLEELNPVNIEQQKKNPVCECLQLKMIWKNLELSVWTNLKNLLKIVKVKRSRQKCIPSIWEAIRQCRPTRKIESIPKELFYEKHIRSPIKSAKASRSDKLSMRILDHYLTTIMSGIHSKRNKICILPLMLYLIYFVL
jgi:hypothetical protein